MKKLYVVGTPIGNLGDISKRALEVLNNVNIIACEDTRVSINLLKSFGINKKLVSYHKFNEREKSISLINTLLTNDVALITDAGCPCISDPGSILVKECIKNNIEVIPIPGASAIISSLMTSGMDTSSFTFYGFLNRENKKIKEDLKKIKSDSSKIAIIYESPKRLIKTLEKIIEILDNPYICLCNDLTKKFEKKYYGETQKVIDELLGNPNYELGEYVIVIEKNAKIDLEETDTISIEAYLTDTIIKNNCTMKEAIKIVCEKYHYNKNIVYNASLNLKNIFNK